MQTKQKPVKCQVMCFVVFLFDNYSSGYVREAQQVKIQHVWQMLELDFPLSILRGRYADAPIPAKDSVFTNTIVGLKNTCDFCKPIKENCNLDGKPMEQAKMRTLLPQHVVHWY